ncbi:MAG: beta-N-acetylhexosaminidase [Chlamydiales bacterium]
MFNCLLLATQLNIGQLLMTYANPGEEQTLIQDLHVGGIIYYHWANDLTSTGKVQALSKKIQEYAVEKELPPVLIGVDQEGGRVSRLTGDFILLPSAQEMRQKFSPATAGVMVKNAGEQMRKAGIHLNFSPVVDVNNNPNNVVIGDRSFGNCPEQVIAYAKSIVQGYLDAGILPCLKHFPGHGDVSEDSHFHLPTVSKSREELNEMELSPYRALVKQVPFIMTAHILFPELDPDYSATFSKKILTGLLREEMGYEGVIITDSLKMKAASGEKISMGEAAIRAFEAGADILMIGGKLLIGADDDEHVQEVKEVRDALSQAVESGRISKKRLQESLDRIISMKTSIATPQFGHPSSQ